MNLIQMQTGGLKVMAAMVVLEESALRVAWGCRLWDWGARKSTPKPVEEDGCA